MQTSSRNGFGTRLLFHQPAGDGQFEATVWVTALYVPILPLSTWLIRPQGMQEAGIPGGTSTTHFVEFVERRRMSPLRVLAMYFWVALTVAAMWAPMILFFVVLSHNEGMEKTWAGALILLPVIWAVALWIWLDYRRDRLYKSALEQSAIADKAKRAAAPKPRHAGELEAPGGGRGRRPRPN
jgi:hypothetical protein